MSLKLNEIASQWDREMGKDSLKVKYGDFPFHY